MIGRADHPLATIYAAIPDIFQANCGNCGGHSVAVVVPVEDDGQQSVSLATRERMIFNRPTRGLVLALSPIYDLKSGADRGEVLSQRSLVTTKGWLTAKR
jgi:hypothetical protein